MVTKAEKIPSEIKSERVDDIPLLLAQLCEMRVPELIHQCFPTHGNWMGLSLGHLVTVWLVFILSQSHHRLSHLRPWAATRLQSLRAGLGVALGETDFTDDRLAQALDYLSDDEGWRAFEDALNQHVLRIYDLHDELVRLDMTTAKAYGQITADGLLQFGHSKDHRPDLPQLKISVSTLDPLGLPLTATIVRGEKADDPLYIPEIERVRDTLQRRGLLFVGDSKMAASRRACTWRRAAIITSARCLRRRSARRNWRSCSGRCCAASGNRLPSGGAMRKPGAGKRSAQALSTRSSLKPNTMGNGSAMRNVVWWSVRRLTRRCRNTASTSG